MTASEVLPILPLTKFDLSVCVGRDRLRGLLSASSRTVGNVSDIPAAACVSSAGLWRLKVGSALIGLARVADTAIVQYDAAATAEDGLTAVHKLLAARLRSETNGVANLLRDYPDYGLTQALHTASTPLSALDPPEVRAFMKVVSDFCHGI